MLLRILVWALAFIVVLFMIGRFDRPDHQTHNIYRDILDGIILLAVYLIIRKYG